MSNQLFQQSVLGYAPQLVATATKSFGADDGAYVTGSTLSSTKLYSQNAASDTYNGQFIRLHKSTAGGKVDNSVFQILDHIYNYGSGSIDRLIIDGELPASWGGTYEILSVVGDPSTKVTSAQTTVMFGCSARASDPLNYWVGAEAIIANGTAIAAGMNQTISSSLASGTIVVDTTLGAVYAGDVIDFRWFGYVENVRVTASQAQVARPAMRNSFDAIRDAAAGKNNGISFDFEISPVTSAWHHRMLEGAFGSCITTDTGSLGALTNGSEIAGCGTTYGQCMVPTATEARWLGTVTTAGTGTLSEAYATTYTGTPTYYASQNYRFSPDAMKHMTFDYWADGMRYRLFNQAMNSLSIKFAANERVMATAEFAGDTFSTTDGTCPIGQEALTNTAPAMAIGCDGYVNGTAVTISDATFTATFGNADKVDITGVEGLKGKVRTTQGATATITILAEDQEYMRQLQSVGRMEVFVSSIAAGHGVGVWMYGQVTGCTAPENKGGLYYQTITLKTTENDSGDRINFTLGVS